MNSVNRTVGTILGSVITENFQDTLKEDTFTVHCQGGGGQSFGAFIPKGLTLTLEGDANDYFGKGLSGGKLVVYPPKGSTFSASENIIIGNVALYGATSGKAYVCGVAGERFCVRNSGATAVSEGCGDHGLEYMTGGCAVILGPTGKNFAAGMSGGIAYVLDLEHQLYKKLNKEMVTMSEVTEKHDIAELKNILKDFEKEGLHRVYFANHYEKHDIAELKNILKDYEKETSSLLARDILEHFDAYLPGFKKILPNDYQKMLHAISKYEEKGLSHEDAALEAFYEIQK